MGALLSTVQLGNGDDTHLIYNLLHFVSGKVKSVVVSNRKIYEEKQIIKAGE